MSLYYRTQQVHPVFGSRLATTPFTRTSVALTDAYTGNQKVIKTAGFSKMNLDILYTMGATESSNTIEVTIEGSPDGTNFYMLPNESNSSGVSTLYARNWTFTGTNAAAATISLGLDVFYQWVRISIRETGVVTNAGTVYAEATLSGA